MAQFIGVGLIVAAAVWLGLAALTGTRWSEAIAWGLGAYAGTAALATFGLGTSFPHRLIGLCNVITLTRLGLTGILFAALFTSAIGAWTIFAIAALAFALDGADGWFARRSGLTSEFGARFDMEVDSVLALTLSILAFQSGAGAYVLILGVPRYAFGAANLIWPWLGGPLPERFSRKVVCVLQIATLLCALLPWAPQAVVQMMVSLSALALVWSFWVDIQALKRARS
ncbi:CDP-alcohol phosphatidyltransferase family protein [Gymnodinialimonas mytili]|uniref:CDP-alcohol phosphatidyltransferase family protein n=1 Tax=Gymnodinialimonas mytili TaxID=3126503 RepID=UPI0030ECF06F